MGTLYIGEYRTKSAARETRVLVLFPWGGYGFVTAGGSFSFSHVSCPDPLQISEQKPDKNAIFVPIDFTLESKRYDSVNIMIYDFYIFYTCYLTWHNIVNLRGRINAGYAQHVACLSRKTSLATNFYFCAKRKGSPTHHLR